MATVQMATSQQDWKLKTRLATVALYMKDTSIAKEMLQAEPPAATDGQSASKRKPNWYDRPLDPSWTHSDDTAKATLAAAHGMLTHRFAYCLDMPWTAFSTMKEALDVCNYRPTRVRPFVHGDQRLVAAIWVARQW